MPIETTVGVHASACVGHAKASDYRPIVPDHGFSEQPGESTSITIQFGKPTPNDHLKTIVPQNPRQLAEELFKQLVSMTAAERTAHLDVHCHDSQVREEVEKLLAYDDVEGGGLTQDSPVRPMDVLNSSSTGRGNLDHPSSASDAIDHGRFLPGTVLSERYRIVGLLGRGGMGEVFRADDLELGQSVALKFLPKRLVEDTRSLERFRGEVRLARQISHPNVCRVYDIGHVDDNWFLSMEYVDGILGAGRSFDVFRNRRYGPVENHGI